MFSINIRFLSEGGKRNITVTHNQTNVKITSPDFFEREKSDEQLKKETWEVMKKALEVWGVNLK